MDTITPAAIATTALSTLTPLATYTVRRCLARIRDAKYIRKVCLVIPRKGGKGFLTSRLGHSQRDYLMVDVDETMLTLCDEKQVAMLKSARDAGRLYEADVLYTEMAVKVLEYVRDKMKVNRSLKALFLTSSFDFARHFKSDSVFVASPDSECFEKGLEAYTPEEREQLRRHRSEFLDACPDRRAVATFRNLEDLESLVRGRLNIQRHL